MKQLKTVVTRSRLLVGSVSTAALAFGNAVYAAVPAGATDSLDTAKTDVSTIGWAVFGVIIAAVAFKYMRRAL